MDAVYGKQYLSFEDAHRALKDAAKTDCFNLYMGDKYPTDALLFTRVTFQCGKGWQSQIPPCPWRLSVEQLKFYGKTTWVVASTPRALHNHGRQDLRPQACQPLSLKWVSFSLISSTSPHPALLF